MQINLADIWHIVSWRKEKKRIHKWCKERWLNYIWRKNTGGISQSSLRITQEVCFGRKNRRMLLSWNRIAVCCNVYWSITSLCLLQCLLPWERVKAWNRMGEGSRDLSNRPPGCLHSLGVHTLPWAGEKRHCRSQGWLVSATFPPQMKTVETCQTDLGIYSAVQLKLGSVAEPPEELDHRDRSPHGLCWGWAQKGKAV